MAEDHDDVPCPGAMASFGNLRPDLAHKELFQVMVPSGKRLPEGDYAFLEFYCPDTTCDCQVVLWHVMVRFPHEVAPPRTRPPVAVLSWCFAPDDLGEPEEEPGPMRPYSDPLLKELRRAIRADRYGEVIKAHYAAVRADGATPGTPAYRTMHRRPPR